MENVSLHAVILAGGAGTRFWPLSRETTPKQMLRILGEDTLLRQTIRRVQGWIPLQNVWIVTTEDQARDIRFHLDPLGPAAKEIRFIVEPMGRNTAPAIGLAAIHLRQHDPESIMVVMPSDHAIGDRNAFIRDVETAVQGAREDALVTFGIKPIRPETGYGYIKVQPEAGPSWKEGRHGVEGAADSTGKKALLKVERFLEKPDLQTARTFLSRGGYFWNSGIFVWKTTRILAEIQRHLPEIDHALKDLEGLLFPAAGKQRQDGVDRNALCAGLYEKMDPVSIDHGILERSGSVRVIPAAFPWSDLGSWASLDEVLDQDPRGNILRGNTLDWDSRNSTVFSDKRLVATIGLRDMVVVDTPDATLITPKERSQEVRKIVEVLKKNHREEHLIHRTVERPWGSFTVLEKGEGYKIKRVVLRPGARLSLQRHKRRSEHWVVVSGTAKVTRGEETFIIQSNESTFIPIQARHRLENPGEGLLQIIEVQNGDYVEEDDIERFDDDYNRS